MKPLPLYGRVSYSQITQIVYVKVPRARGNLPEYSPGPGRLTTLTPFLSFKIQGTSKRNRPRGSRLKMRCVNARLGAHVRLSSLVLPRRYVQVPGFVCCPGGKIRPCGSDVRTIIQFL